MKKLLVGSGAALVLASVLVWATVVRPWTAWPGPKSALDARWAEVVAWAGRPAEPPAPNSPALDRLVAAMESQNEPIDDYVPVRGDAIPVAEAANATTRGAVDALVAWHSEGGGFGAGCSPRMPRPRANSIAMLQTARAALATATADADDARFQAALHLASDLRKEGGLLEGVVGATIAREAAATARDRRREPDGAFREWRPKKEEIFPAIARDVVCGQRLLVKEIGRDGGSTLYSPRPHLARFVSIEREVLMVRTYHSDELHRAEPHRNDPHALAAALALDPERLPKSLLVRVFAVDFSGPLKNWAAAIDEYDAYLATAPQAP